MKTDRAGRRRASLALVTVVVTALGLSYRWAIWDRVEDTSWPRYLWAALCGFILAAHVFIGLRPAMRRLRSWALRMLPALWLGGLIVGLEATHALWPELERWHAITPTLTEDMIVPPVKLARSWWVYGSLKKRAGAHPIYLTDNDLFAPFLPEMLELHVESRPLPKPISTAGWNLLEKAPRRDFDAIRKYLPAEIHERYRVVETEQPESYFVFRAETGIIWLVPESVLQKAEAAG